MIVRFCLYSIFKNLRFFEPFFVIYLLAGPAVGGPDLDFFQIGALVAYQKLLTGLLEIPLGAITDRYGRVRALIACFGVYACAFPVYAISASLEAGIQLAALYLAQTLFGLGEALRTGSHKAIMLDWADQAGEDATRVVSVARFFSKTAAGVSALAGGLVLYATASFVGLFWGATAAALAGLVLMTTYPRELNGEQLRASEVEARPPFRAQLRRLWVRPGLLVLVVESVLLESQIKLAQHYLQPFLKLGLEQEDVAVVGALGAILIGLYYLVQDVLGGVSAVAAVPLERRAGGRPAALRMVYLAAVAAAAAIALALQQSWLVLGVIGYVAIAALQNMRRPIFVAELNERMDKPQRATMLSIESQARSFGFAIFALLTGWIADHYTLEWAITFIPVLLAAAIALRPALVRVEAGLLRAPSQT